MQDPEEFGAGNGEKRGIQSFYVSAVVLRPRKCDGLLLGANHPSWQGATWYLDSTAVQIPIQGHRDTPSHQQQLPEIAGSPDT